MKFRFGVILAALAVAACDSTTSVNLGTGSRLNLVNASKSSGTVNLFVDGQLVGSAGAGNLVRSTDLAPGAHDVQVLPAGGGAGFTRTVTFAAGSNITVVAFDSNGAMRPSILLDTGAVVPAGATKLRVAHYAATSGNIDIWRTQPDFGTPIRVAFPIANGFVSPYLQSTVGNWRVLVSTAVPGGGSPAMPDTLAMTGLIAIPDGQSRTVVVLDKNPAGVEIVVLEP